MNPLHAVQCETVSGLVLIREGDCLPWRDAYMRAARAPSAPFAFPVELWFEHSVILSYLPLPACPPPPTPCFHLQSEGNEGRETAYRGPRLQRIR